MARIMPQSYAELIGLSMPVFSHQKELISVNQSFLAFTFLFSLQLFSLPTCACINEQAIA